MKCKLFKSISVEKYIILFKKCNLENFKHPPTCGPKKWTLQTPGFGLDGGQENCCLDGPVRWQNGLLMLPKCENPFKNSHSDDKFPLFSHLKDPEYKQDERKCSNKITF